MNTELIKAYLNLHAILQNFEELVAMDDEARALASKWNLSIQFVLPGGPAAQVKFTKGRCFVTQGFDWRSDIILAFSSASHLNKVMENKGTPILLRGVTKLPFLLKEFPKISARLEAVLKPNPEALTSPVFLALHTQLLLQTAAFASAVLSHHDPKARLAASRIAKGTVALRVGGGGPAVHLVSSGKGLAAVKGDTPKPTALMAMRDIPTAQRFLSGTTDPFTAIALGDVEISGLTPMLDSMSLILDRIDTYLK